MLCGAKAFAVPLHYGQTLNISHHPKAENQLKWMVRDTRGDWFWVLLQTLPSLKIIDTNSKSQAQKLLRAILAAHRINSNFKLLPGTYLATNDIDFDRYWGLGTSSSFISNLAYWMGVNPHELHSQLSSGSGYDIACARSHKPLIYQLQHTAAQQKQLEWHPPFANQLAFVYLGQKQQSEKSIREFDQSSVSHQSIDEISHISQEMTNCQKLPEFEYLLKTHEQIMSGVLKKSAIQDERFSDFNGSIKSLGAWGGDFIIAASAQDYDQTRMYFIKKGHEVVLPWKIIMH